LKNSSLIDEDCNVGVAQFNGAINLGKNGAIGVLERFEGSNTAGMFRVKFQNGFYYCAARDGTHVSYATECAMERELLCKCK
jgi:hypothetical protein